MSTAASPSSSARILVVRLGAMGDILHALPAVASLKQSYPASHLTWVVEPRWAPLLEGNPFIERIVLFDRSRLATLARSWRDLRSQPYDLAVDFQGLIKSALVAAASGAPRIVGYRASQAREPLAALFYSDKVRVSSSHAVERNLDLASAAGSPTHLRTFPLPPGRPEGSLPAGPFILASPLAGWPAKQWPLEYYTQLAARLRRDAGIPLVLNGPPWEEAKLAAVPGALVHLSSLEGLIDATRRAAAVVGLDSGPMHLAAALARPGVAIFGPTDPARNGPYGASFTVLRSPSAVTSYKRRGEIDPSMREVTPDAVFEALKPRLAPRSHPADCLA